MWYLIDRSFLTEFHYKNIWLKPQDCASPSQLQTDPAVTHFSNKVKVCITVGVCEPDRYFIWKKSPNLIYRPIFFFLCGFFLSKWLISANYFGLLIHRSGSTLCYPQESQMMISLCTQICRLTRVQPTVYSHDKMPSVC